MSLTIYDHKYFYLSTMCFALKTQKTEEVFNPTGYPVQKGLYKCEVFLDLLKTFALAHITTHFLTKLRNSLFSFL